MTTSMRYLGASLVPPDSCSHEVSPCDECEQRVIAMIQHAALRHGWKLELTTSYLSGSVDGRTSEMKQ